MSSLAPFFKYLAFVLMTLTGIAGGLFAAGDALSELDTPRAIGTTAPWVVLAVALSAFAFWSRRIAPWALAMLSAFTVVRTPVESALGLTDQDDPFSAVWVLVLGVALGFLALHHTQLAGGLLAMLGIGQLVASLISADRGSAELGGLLTTPSGAVVVPVLISAVLFLTADAIHRGAPGHRTGAGPRRAGQAPGQRMKQMQ